MDLDFSNDFVLKGKWWIPSPNGNASEIICYGSLHHSLDEGIQLELYGSLFGTKNIFSTKNNELVKDIYGIVRNGKKVTLIDCYGSEFGTSSLIESKYQAKYMAIHPTHFLTVETDIFTALHLNFNCSEAFFHSLYGKLSFEVDDDDSKRLFKHLKTPTKNILDTPELTTTLFFGFGFSFSNTNESDFSFRQKVFFNTDFKKEKKLQELIQFGENIKWLFAFFCRRMVFFNSFTAKEISTPENFQFLFSQPNRSKGGKLDHNSILVNYNDFNGSFEQVYEWWLKHQDFVNKGLSIYMQFVYNLSQSQQHKFLSVVFALETLHTEFFNKTPFDKQAYTAFKSERDAANISELYRDRFKECLTHFNSLSLKKRLEDYIEMNTEILQELDIDLGDYARVASNHRNYLSHNHSSDKSSISDNDLSYYIAASQLLYTLTFLKLVGVNSLTIKKTVKGNFDMQYYLRR